MHLHPAICAAKTPGALVPVAFLRGDVNQAAFRTGEYDGDRRSTEHRANTPWLTILPSGLHEFDRRDRPLPIVAPNRNSQTVKLVEPNPVHRPGLSIRKGTGLADELQPRAASNAPRIVIALSFAVGMVVSEIGPCPQGCLRRKGAEVVTVRRRERGLLSCGGSEPRRALAAIKMPRGNDL